MALFFIIKTCVVIDIISHLIYISTQYYEFINDVIKLNSMWQLRFLLRLLSCYNIGKSDIIVKYFDCCY